ncbi:MAG TPA: phosphoesterase, partial [Phenylobacterium sp.]|nr:phosphoesterase [Phenylobacterium sp.]
WVTGNHERDSVKTLPGEMAEEIALAGLILRHEPLPGLAWGEVAGHLHPCAVVVGKGRSVRRRCFVTDGERLILPAFGAYAGGLNVRDAAFAGLFARSPLMGALGKDRVHPVGWRSVARD